MQLAVAGKGGSGKTTIAGTLARVLARRGRLVRAVDADSNPNLAISIGVEPSVAFSLGGLPPDLLEVRGPSAHDDRRIFLTSTPQEIFERHGVAAPEGIRLVVGSRVDHAATGCNCRSHATVQAMIRELATESDDVTVLDLEAGLEHLKRGTPTHTD